MDSSAFHGAQLSASADQVHASVIKGNNKSNNKEQAHASVTMSTSSIKGGARLAETSLSTIAKPSVLNETSATTCTMPTTTIFTTTAVTTAMNYAGNTQAITTTVNSSTTLFSDIEYNDPIDGKRKAGEPGAGGQDGKCFNQGESKNCTNYGGAELMEMMLSEFAGLKGMINNVDRKIETIQEENTMWRTKLESVVTEVSEVKESLEMAHNLITDEKNERASAVQILKNEIMERGKEIGTNVQLIKTQASEIKSL